MNGNTPHSTGPWGYHLMLDCAACNRDAVKDADNIKAFLKDIVKRIDMIAVGEPEIRYIDPNPDLAGYSVCQFIMTSDIMMHLMDISGDAYVCVFSCKEFEPETAIQCFKEYFNPERIKQNFVIRQA